MTVRGGVARIQLPFPYPDELLYSVIARYQSRVGPVNERALVIDVFERDCRVRVEIPSFLNTVSSKTFELWGMTAIDLALLHTQFPYYAYASDPDLRDSCLRSLQTSEAINKQTQFRISNNWVMSPHWLKYCPDCHAAEIEVYGESYWHRLHQLPGVLICPLHEVFLNDSTAVVNPHRAPLFADATTSLPSKCMTNKIAKKISKPNALRIAQKSQNLLRTSAPIPHDIRFQYLDALNSIDVFRQDQITAKKLSGALIDCVGVELLKAIGFQSPANHGGWIQNIFRYKPYFFHTLEHLIFQIFLEKRSQQPLDSGC